MMIFYAFFLEEVLRLPMVLFTKVALFFKSIKKEIFFYSRISQVDITLFIGRGFLAFFR